MEEEEEEEFFEVESIIDSKVRKGKTEYRIRWKGYGSDDDTWETEDNLENCKELLDLYWAVKKSEKEKKATSKGRTSQKRKEVTEKSKPVIKEQIDIKTILGMTKANETIYYVGEQANGERVWISSERMKREKPLFVIDYLLPKFELHYAIQEREKEDKREDTNV